MVLLNKLLTPGVKPVVSGALGVTRLVISLGCLRLCCLPHVGLKAPFLFGQAGAPNPGSCLVHSTVKIQYPLYF